MSGNDAMRVLANRIDGWHKECGVIFSTIEEAERTGAISACEKRALVDLLMEE